MSNSQQVLRTAVCACLPSAPHTSGATHSMVRSFAEEERGYGLTCPLVDGLDTTRYAYNAAAQLLTEDGPFTSDTVTNTYSNRKRLALRLQQPAGAWTNGFVWDLAGRLTNVTSGAGPFSYRYTALDSSFSGRLVQRLSLPNGAAATNLYDPVARLLDSVLKSSGGITLDAAYNGYNVNGSPS